MDLYDPVIIRYNKRKDQYEKRADAQYVIDAANPICGDAFQLYFDIKDDVIQQVTFSGYGCAVSKASTSILVEMIEKMEIIPALEAIRSYLLIVENGVETLSVNPQWKAFQKAGSYPGRMQCATLSWKAFEQKFAKTK